MQMLQQHSNAGVALQQHSETCAPLRQLVAKYGQALQQLLHQFNTGQAQQISEAVEQALELGSFIPTTKAAAYQDPETLHLLMTQTVKHATMKDLVSLTAESHC